MSDENRTNLTLQMRCAKCGRILRFTYDRPATIRDEVDNADSFSMPGKPELAGAQKLQLSAFVHPCHACYTEAATPVRLLKRAIERAVNFEKLEDAK